MILFPFLPPFYKTTIAQKITQHNKKQRKVLTNLL
uniref:Uncharacterized protein n=1 Tax=Siphoviridae sp. ctXmm2 TaxID=2825546 RepID=A0A8S5QI37_9CAUD|nr:MAG TPA: hypothetical protein [Siphoviridae sp. ctXmm2]